MKRGIEEAYSDDLDDFVAQLDARETFASALAWVEVSRGLRSRLDAENPVVVVDRIENALSAVHQVPLSQQVVSYARRIGSIHLRSLDAIHLASATLISADVFVAYDRRLLTVAAEMGFATLSPGADE